MHKTLLVVLFFAGACGAAIQFPHGRTAYIAAAPASPLDKRTVERLAAYLKAVTGAPPRIVATASAAPAGQPVIVLGNLPAGHPESFTIDTDSAGRNGSVKLSGSTDRGLKRAVQRLILKSRQLNGGLEIGDLHIAETPWIAEREWTVCPWVPQNVRGIFANPFADNRMNIWNYSGR
ncbi:MAG: hypothetical protein ABIZ80_08210, partial [Bryobacteraceae bacterium]